MAGFTDYRSRADRLGAVRTLEKWRLLWFFRCGVFPMQDDPQNEPDEEPNHSNCAAIHDGPELFPT